MGVVCFVCVCCCRWLFGCFVCVGIFVVGGWVVCLVLCYYYLVVGCGIVVVGVGLLG